MGVQTTESDVTGGLRTRVTEFWRAYLPVWFMTPLVLVTLLITIFPGVYDLYLSLVHYKLTRPGTIGEFAGLENFANAFTNAGVVHSAKITLLFVGGALFLETTLGFVLAALVKDVESERMTTVYRIGFILPMAVAPVSLATIFRIMLNSSVGVFPYLVNTYTPFTSPAFLQDFPLLTVILIDTWHWTPFMFIIFYAGLTSVPNTLIEATRVDGAPLWRRYVHVVIPYMKPVVFVAVLIRLIDLFRSFGTVYSLTRGGPGDATDLIAINIFNNAFKFADLGVASAVAVIYLVFIVALCNVLIAVVGFEGVWES